MTSMYRHTHVHLGCWCRSLYRRLVTADSTSMDTQSRLHMLLCQIVNMADIGSLCNEAKSALKVFLNCSITTFNTFSAQKDAENSVHHRSGAGSLVTITTLVMSCAIYWYKIMLLGDTGRILLT